MPGPQAILRTVGRYTIGPTIAVGGMASVHYGKLNGPAGFTRTVAIKRMLESYANTPQARAMLIDEARLSSRVSHANVVQTLDVVEEAGELYLVLEYVHGESLDRLLERCRERARPVPVPVALAACAGVLRGLEAAHRAVGEDGKPLELVHRDLSPHNILVDTHGVSRVLDFGVARARGRLQGTVDGQLKGKLAYLSPEQVHGDASPRSDVFAAGVVLWECLTGEQLFQGRSEAELLSNVLLCRVPRLAERNVELPGVQAVLDRALARDPAERFTSAAEMAQALEALGPASTADVATWVNQLAGEVLATRAAQLAEMERTAVTVSPPPAAISEPPPVLNSRFPWAGLIGGGGAVLFFVVVSYLLKPLLTPAAPERVVRELPPAHTAKFIPLVPMLAHPDAAITEPAPVGEPAPPHVTPKPPAPGCNPPYVIDAQGVKRFKPECFK